MHDVRSPARSDAEHPVDARGSQSVPRGVQGAARQGRVKNRDGHANLVGGGFAPAAARCDAQGSHVLICQAGGDLDNVPAGASGHRLPQLFDDHSNVNAHASRVVHGRAGAEAKV